MEQTIRETFAKIVLGLTLLAVILISFLSSAEKRTTTNPDPIKYPRAICQHYTYNDIQNWSFDRVERSYNFIWIEHGKKLVANTNDVCRVIDEVVP